MNPPLICLAHRGASGHAPENTLAAFRKAVDLGADWIELDVYAVSGEVVVIHDKRLERTTSGTGRVTGRRLEYLKTLDAGQGEKIPFLSQVLDAMDRRININIELKGSRTVRPVLKLLERYVTDHGWRYDQFLLSSFNHNRVRAVRSVCRQIAVAPNLSENFRRPERILNRAAAFYSIHLAVELASRRLVQAIHQRGCRVFVFTVDEMKTIRQLRDMGVDGIFTNYPERVIQCRE
ncbi:MAG: glycerophosphodiester phosphodiesterase [Desulfosudaceae bacterium]